MISNLDIYHTAKVFVKHYGKNAPALGFWWSEPCRAGRPAARTRTRRTGVNTLSYTPSEWGAT